MNTKNWVNVFLLGFGFFLLFSAFQTVAFIQTLTISSYLSPKCNSGKDHVPFGVLHNQGFADRVGYISGAIIYLMVAIGNWISVVIVATCGAKLSLVLSGLLYVVYIACLIRPLVETVFIGAFILGLGGGVLWTAQGQILIQNSSKERMGTTSGIFWLMLESSLIAGSVYVFTYFYLESGSKTSNDTCFEHTQNMILFSILTACALGGVFVLIFIKPVRRTGITVNEDCINSKTDMSENKALLNNPRDNGEGKRSMQIIVKSISNAVKMMLTKEMLLLSVTFIYTGYELNYWSGVYGTVIGHTTLFPKYSIGLSLFFIGLGEIVGGGLFGILGSYTNHFGRDPVILIGLLAHLVCYLLSFLFLPSPAIASDVWSPDCFGALGAFNIESSIYAAMVGAFLLGFGDACFNTQIYSIIGVLYPSDEKSAPAMALYKFFQSMAAMVGFFTSTMIALNIQLIALVVLAVLGSITFAVIEWEYHRRERQSLTITIDPHTEYLTKAADSASTLGEEAGFFTDSGNA